MGVLERGLEARATGWKPAPPAGSPRHRLGARATG
jgi:hypothetical protein